MKTLLKKLQSGAYLTSSETEQAVTAILDGGASPAQIGAFLMGLSQRGETVDEIVSAARVIKA